RRASGWFVTLAAVYLVFVASMGLMQKSLMYFPDATRFVPNEWALQELKPLHVTAEDGLATTSWYRPALKSDKFTIVFFQGNAG
ncbi:hypothetical protein ACI394_29505, partial [Klebsiella pneumoniae]|uniref:hypothetical protein n=1 Tax=Klebsiella pneumoniae TaxID=573 RepID=UPI0038541A25